MQRENLARSEGLRGFKTSQNIYIIAMYIIAVESFATSISCARNEYSAKCGVFGVDRTIN
jgi:hypothetical protein